MKKIYLSLSLFLLTLLFSSCLNGDCHHNFNNPSFFMDDWSMIESYERYDLTNDVLITKIEGETAFKSFSFQTVSEGIVKLLVPGSSFKELPFQWSVSPDGKTLFLREARPYIIDPENFSYIQFTFDIVERSDNFMLLEHVDERSQYDETTGEITRIKQTTTWEMERQ